MMFVSLVLLVVQADAGSCAADDASCNDRVLPPKVGTCIIGAGPGGLQLGQLMNTAGRDYIILEQDASAGTFFATHPRHRKLISLNKRFTGRSEAEFNLRHDWNSLLDHPSIPPMTNRTEEKWPPADILVQYLEEYAKVQEDAGKIIYNATVTRIATRWAAPPPGLQDVDGVGKAAKSTEKPPGHRFAVTVTLGGAGAAGGSEPPSAVEERVLCRSVVMATGLSKPNVPASVVGIEHAIGYEELPETGRPFEKQSVLVLGLGNAAFETANELSSFTNFVHVVPGRLSAETTATEDPHSLVSWESRYVGNVRAINAGLFDSYLLKSLDGVAASPDAQGSIMAKCGPETDSKVCVFVKADGGKTVHAGRYSTRDPEAVALAGEIKRLGLGYSNPVDTSDSRIWLGVSGRGPAAGGGPSAGGQATKQAKHTLAEGDLHVQSMFLIVNMDALVNNASLTTQVMELARRGGTPHPLVYDKVIRCLGWQHGTDVYDADATPIVQYNGKYPAMTSEYESVNVAGLYFAGTLGHGKDHLKSAGGFIHGFRYTTRALFRILETKHDHSQYLHDAAFRAGPLRLWPAQTTHTNVEDWTGAGVGLGPNGCNAGDWTMASGSTCSEPVTPTSPFEGLLNQIFTRINIASGPYQMVSVLADGVVFRCAARGGTGGDGGGDQPPPRTMVAEYLEEVPTSYFHARFDQSPRILWHFGYEKQRQSLHDSRRLGTLFQVHLWYYPGTGGGCGALDALPKEQIFTIPAEMLGLQQRMREKEIVRVAEELHANWNAWEMRQRIGEWIHAKVTSLLADNSGHSAGGSAAGGDGDDGGASAQATLKEAADKKVKDDAATLRDCMERLPKLSKASTAACVHETKGADAGTPDERAACQLVNGELAELVALCTAVFNQNSVADDLEREEERREAAREAEETAQPLLGGDVDLRRAEGDRELQRCIAKETEPISLGPGRPLPANKLEQIHWHCAKERGKAWPGGRVELNIANNCGGAVSLWYGSLLHFSPPILRPLRKLVNAGAGRRVTSYERETWKAVGGGGEVILEWVVDIANGPVQDIVLDKCGAYEPATEATIRKGLH